MSEKRFYITDTGLGLDTESDEMYSFGDEEDFCRLFDKLNEQQAINSALKEENIELKKLKKYCAEWMGVKEENLSLQCGEMSDERFAIKPQDDYWAVIDNYNGDKVCIINGIHTEIEAIWLCDFMNEQQATISALKEENMGLRAKHTQMVIIMKDVVKDLKRIDTYRYAEHLEKIANLRFLSEKELDDE